MRDIDIDIDVAGQWKSCLKNGKQHLKSDYKVFKNYHH